MTRTIVAGVVAALACLVPRPAEAHKPSDAQVRVAVRGNTVAGGIDLALRDLDAAIGLDADGDGRLTWAEVNAATQRIQSYVRERLVITAHGGTCPLELGEAALVDLSDGTYWSQPLDAHCASDDALALSYRLLFDVDAQHRGLVHVAGARGRTFIVRDAAPLQLDSNAGASVRAFIVEGIWHIWRGLDHVLFLMALILPSVWASRRRCDAGTRESLRHVAIEVFEIVTAFTLAHSITLVLSAVGFVRLPSRFIETSIALSVVAAAVNNLLHAVDARWAVAFALGLLHGFGFSSVLIDLGLASHELVRALLGFNLGVEIGQAALVLVLLPLLFLIRRTLLYRVLLCGGSAAIAAVALVWSYQRWSL